MFEVTTYLVPWFFVFLLAMIGAVVLPLSSVFWTAAPSESGKIGSTITVLSILMLLIGTFFFLTRNTEIVDNPNSVTVTNKISIAADEDEIIKKIEEELNIQNVSIEQDKHLLTHLLVVDGDAVDFTAVDGVKAINGIIHFTNDEMVLTVFNEADETVVIPTR